MKKREIPKKRKIGANVQMSGKIGEGEWTRERQRLDLRIKLLGLVCAKKKSKSEST